MVNHNFRTDLNKFYFKLTCELRHFDSNTNYVVNFLFFSNSEMKKIFI